MRLQAFRYLGGATVLLLLTAASAAAQLRVMTYVSGLSRPVGFVQDPSDAAVQYVVEQSGTIRVVNNGVLLTTPFLQIPVSEIISDGERGLLGVAFPPNYATSGRFYVLYTRAGDGYIVVERRKRSINNRFLADTTARFALRWSTGDSFIVHPFANHNAGCLQFGPDGMLYIASGDGGSGGDPSNYAQNTSSLLGKILRIDVSSVADTDANGFVVPTGNAGLPRPEIWSLGWRNPWRFSFDSPALGGTGAMVVGDVGQGNWEEIDYEPANRPGRNYGWRLWEGTHPYNQPAGTPLLTQPIFDYSHSMGASVTGGYVYRGSVVELRGRYFFADYVFQRVWSLGLSINGAGEATATDLRDHTPELTGSVPVGRLSSFGIDADGDLYLVDHSRGMVLKLGRDPRPPTNVRIIRD
ncbi:MAG: PQQ-dependent sugar dehydrogenase [Vicinamibacterales bacterium]